MYELMSFIRNYNNKFPRQIIIPLSYLNLINFLSFSKIQKLKNRILKIFNLKKNNLIFIGRARTALYLILEYFLKNSDKKIVLIAPFTIPAIIHLINKVGAKSLIVDFEKNTTCLKLDDLKKKIRKYKPLALIITHYHINEQKYKEICSYCKKYDVKVIEDCAISYFGKAQETKLNTLSDASFFSFSSFKSLNYFYGGLIYTKNKNLYKFINNNIKNWKKLTVFDYVPQAVQTKLYQLLTLQFIFNYFTFFLIKQKNFKKEEKKKYFSSINIEDNYFTLPGKGFYWELNSKIQYLKKIIQHRQKISEVYYHYLKKLSVMPANFKKKDIFNNSFYFYLIQTENSDVIRKKLHEKGLDTGKLFYENCAKISKNSKKKDTKNIDNLINKIIILPTHMRIKKSYAKLLSETILEIIQEIKNEKSKISK